MGLAHIIEARQRKDGMSEVDAIRFLGDIVDAIAYGGEFSRTDVEQSTRVGVSHEDTIVWLTKRSGENAWIVTGYEKSPDGRAAGRATVTPTQSAASLTRDGSVAGLDSNVAQDQSSRMDRISFNPADYMPGANKPAPKGFASPSIQPRWQRFLSLRGFFESAADLLKRTPGLEGLGNAVVKYYACNCFHKISHGVGWLIRVGAESIPDAWSTPSPKWRTSFSTARSLKSAAI